MNRTCTRRHTRYDSNMCSTDGERIARLTQAIDDLAAEGLAGLPPEDQATLADLLRRLVIPFDQHAS